MAYRDGNYTAFFVKKPFDSSNLGANATRDFVFYNQLRAYKGENLSFPFIDSHAKNYNVRDDSDWEKTLKPRIHERLDNSKNIVLFLSSITKNSKALREEIDYGMNKLKLPVIVIYPDYQEKNDIINCNSGSFKQKIKDLWDLLPIFRDSMSVVPTIHIPNNKKLIRQTLEDKDFMVNTKGSVGSFYYKCD